MQIHLRRIILVFQIVALAILLVVTLACSPDVAATFQNDHALTLDLACQPTELCWGDQLSVLASCENAGEVITVDLYLAVVLPDGDVFYFPDGSLSAPFISSVIIPELASFTDVEVFSGEMPAGLQTGEYLWILGATTPGTLDVLEVRRPRRIVGLDKGYCYSFICSERSASAALSAERYCCRNLDSNNLLSDTRSIFSPGFLHRTVITLESLPGGSSVSQFVAPISSNPADFAYCTASSMVKKRPILSFASVSTRRPPMNFSTINNPSHT